MSVTLIRPFNVRECFSKLGYVEEDFTAGEREAIVAKANEHMEDCEPEQAVALAIKSCAPTKAQGKASMGGQYEWSKNSDGTYNIFDVPVFAKHVRQLGMKLVADGEGNPKVEEVTINVDEKWLNKAVELNRRRYEQGQYMGPLHVRHHPRSADDGEDTTVEAGHFLLKYVKSVQFEGETVPMLYSDWLRIPAEIFKRIQAGRLPYRSIESLPPNFNEIDSIALLATDVPYFRLPLTSVGKEITRQVYAAKSPSPFRGFARGKNPIHWSALFYQGGEEFRERDEKSEKEAADEEKSDKAGAPGGAPGAGRPMDAAAGEDDEQAEILGEEPGETGGNVMGEILKALQALAKTQELVLEKLGGAATPPTPVTDGTPALDKPGKAGKPSEQPMQFAADARVAALESVVNGMVTEKELASKVEKAMGELAKYSLASNTREKMLAVARASKDADAALALFVETIKQHATPAPDAQFSAPRGGVPIPPPGESIPEPLRAYFGESPEKGAKALACWNAYGEALRRGLIARTMSQADFVKYNLTKDYSALVTG